MYGYLSIYSDPKYSRQIKTEVLEQYLISKLYFTKDSNLKFSKEMDGQFIRLTGIPANSKGNYAFNSLEGVEEINLIEIDIPTIINEDIERAISDIAEAIAKEFSWIIDAR